MVPPLNPLPGGTLTDAVANVPRVAATLARVGSGPRWDGFPAADARTTANPEARTAAVMATAATTRLLTWNRITSLPRCTPRRLRSTTGGRFGPGWRRCGRPGREAPNRFDSHRRHGPPPRQV